MAWTSADTIAQDAAAADWARRELDPVAHKALIADRQAEAWFSTERGRLLKLVAPCFTMPGRMAPMWFEAAGHYSQLSDLCLFAQRAAEIGWTAAKAGYEAYQRDAEYPAIVIAAERVDRRMEAERV
jgi:hypothetical protein